MRGKNIEIIKIRPLIGSSQQMMPGLNCPVFIRHLMLDMTLVPLNDKARITIRQAFECVNQLSGHQRLYKKTGSSHAVMLFDSQLNSLSMSEDVGRHNALDKSIGKVFMDGKIANAGIAVLSSRISYELIQKAARAQIPILLSMSHPTALAVELGRTLNMTLVCFRKESGVLVFCGEERLNGAKDARSSGR